MIYGFTGSHEGMTLNQAIRVDMFLRADFSEINLFHHGDCIGADNQAAILADQNGWITVAHPPIKEYRRAFHISNIILDPKPYLKRDRDIAKESSTLIATPKTIFEVKRSGTWTTVRYAREIGRRTILIYPNGSYTIEKGRAT